MRNKAMFLWIDNGDGKEEKSDKQRGDTSVINGGTWKLGKLGATPNHSLKSQWLEKQFGL